MDARRVVAAFVLGGALIAAPGRAQAQAADDATAAKNAKAAKAAAAAADNYDEQFARFLKEARSTASKPTESWGWMTGLSFDQRARRINDLITIRVVESISASGTADAALAKASDAKAGVGLFGLEKKLPSS